MSNVIFSMMTSSTESLSQLSSHITGLIAEVSEELRFDKVCLKGIYKQFWECTGEFHHERSNSDPITIDSYVAQKSKMLLGILEKQIIILSHVMKRIFHYISQHCVISFD